jgi:cysteinyl-tRNA synthetase
MKLYNTLTRQVEHIEPMSAGAIGLYACGPTVYDFAHLGHLRKFTMDDVLVRTLRHAGLDVKFVQNITDVGHLASDADTGEDKMEKGAKKYNKTVWEVARQFEEHFFYSMDQMGNVRPDVSCRATEHIPEQLEMVQQLERKGYTYVIDGDGVYFDTSKLDDYGKLARLDIEQLKEGARVEMIEGKRNPTDFALWKFERPGENRAMVWPSPWHPRSFPGWHIECSAMSMKYLGEQFDIHTGGIDHIPVHHTNEIAQAEAATGKKPFVKYWVHHNFLQVEGEKMSKSLGNFFTIDDVIKRGYHPYALRLLFLTAHYRSEMNFTWSNLDGAQKSYERLVTMVASWQESQAEGAKNENEQEFEARFFSSLENDLNTPEAMAVLWEVTKSDLTHAVKLQLALTFDEILGLGLNKAKDIAKAFKPGGISLDELPVEIRTLVMSRQNARERKDWQIADRARDMLLEKGYDIKDEPDGSQTISLSHNH